MCPKMKKSFKPKKIETIHYFYHPCVRKKIQICQKYSYFLGQRATHKIFKKSPKKMLIIITLVIWQLVWFQDSILEHLHHHTLFSMLFDKIFEIHHAQILSCFRPRAGVWLTVRPIFLSFWLASLIFSIMLRIQLGLPHPSIAGIFWCVCTNSKNKYVKLLHSGCLIQLVSWLLKGIWKLSLIWVFVSLCYVMTHVCDQSMCKTKLNMVLKSQGLAKEQKKDCHSSEHCFCCIHLIMLGLGCEGKKKSIFFCLFNF
jgi:hypothetical protein